MIRILHESDRDLLMDYLSKEETVNIYLLTNITVLGIENKELIFYGEMDKYNNFLSVVLVAPRNIVFYSHDRSFNIEWLNILKGYEFSYFSGEESIMRKIAPYYNDLEVKVYFLAETSQMNEKFEKNDYEILEMTTEDLFIKLYHLLKQDTQFDNRTQDKKEFVDSRMKYLEYGTTYYIEKDDEIIATATAYNYVENIASVSMVNTVPHERKKGLATLLMKRLMHKFIEVEHKSMCLFYDNPQAGKIYKRLGFKDVHKWMLLRKKNLLDSN